MTTSFNLIQEALEVSIREMISGHGQETFTEYLNFIGDLRKRLQPTFFTSTYVRQYLWPKLAGDEDLLAAVFFSSTVFKLQIPHWEPLREKMVESMMMFTNSSSVVQNNLIDGSADEKEINELTINNAWFVFVYVSLISLTLLNAIGMELRTSKDGDKKNSN